MQLNNIVIMAAAGAGKTHDICKEVIENAKTTNKKILITTYTNKGIESIEKEYKKQNNGVIDKNVVILSWFQFLLRELVKPYQSSILNKINIINSIDFNHQYGYINFNPRETSKHYMLNNNILSNTVSEFAKDSNIKSNKKVMQRLEEIYSHIYIDEIQDLAGEDIEILNLFFNSKVQIQCVGDVKQSTYTTYNAKKNKKITGIHLIDFFKELERKGIITLQFNNKTKRFGREICEFSNSICNDKNNRIESDKIYKEENQGVYLLDKKDFENYFKIYKPTILKFNAKTKIDYDSLNFGQCKGMTFDRVAIFPNNKYKEFLKNGTSLDSPCKYYVSATRARYSIVFVVEKLFENDNFKYTNINLEDNIIKVSKYMV